MKRFLITAIFSAALFSVVTGNAIYAQIPGAQNPGAQAPNPQEPNNPAAPNPGVVPPSQQREPSDDSRSVTLIGCLAKGSAADQYVITDQKSGEKVTFGGPTQLDKFLNQTVQLSGTASSRTGAQGFRPESIKAVSPSCDAAPQK
jgi:uncharacterized protein YdeI (BOF family)